MKIIEYFTSEDRAHWLEEMRRCDWSAGQYLASLLEESRLKDLVGRTALVPLLTDGEKLAAFCTFAPLDEVQPTELSPWIGFVYTFPEYRLQGCAGMLLDYAACVATVMGREAVYISSGHTGLYEKYGYVFFRHDRGLDGEPTRVYRRLLQAEGAEKDDRMRRGAQYKSEIVALAKRGVNSTAVCGFSCEDCDMWAWCGGCRSVFGCCSYGTLFPGGKCPNVTCCEEKGLEGCFRCPDLESCGKGFYARRRQLKRINTGNHLRKNCYQGYMILTSARKENKCT